MKEQNTGNKLERYHLLFKNSMEGMLIFERDGNILEANQHIANMLRFDVDELIGKNVFEFMLPEETGDAVDRAQKARTGEIVPITERTVIRKDGSTFIGEANLSPIMDDDGNLLCLFGVLRDLTERKQLEQALKENK